MSDKTPRMGKVSFTIEYFVDLNDESMVDYAKDSIVEDVYSYVNTDSVDIAIKVEEAPDKTPADIPHFIAERLPEGYIEEAIKRIMESKAKEENENK